MTDSPRPEDLGEQRTPVGPEPEHEEGDVTAADPRSEPGARGALANVPYWIIVAAVILAAIVFLVLSGVVFPAR